MGAIVPIANLQPTPNPGSQLDRSIQYYFIGNNIGLWKWAKTGDVIVCASDGLGVKSFPNITILSSKSSHTPELTGIEEFSTRIITKFGLAGVQQSSDAYANRVARDRLVGLVMACMMQSADNATLDATAANITAAGRALPTIGSEQDQQNNADMSAFTCLHCYFNGSTRGESDEAGVAWVEVRDFRISCCPSAIDMA